MNNQKRSAALITGGATRLGLAFSNLLASMNYDIALHYNGSVDAASVAKKNIEKLGVSCALFQADLSSSDPTDLVSKVVARYPNIKVLVNSASVYDAASIANTSLKTLEKQFAVNVFAPFMLTKAFANTFFQNSNMEGQVINILDNKIAFQQYSYAAYLLSKKSLADFTKIAAIEFAPKIRVNAIAPGVILPGDQRTSDYLAWRVDGIPLKKQGEVEDLLKAMQYIINSNFITGQILTVDGGEGINHQGLNAEQFNGQSDQDT
jgi:NAD(P)-dependent dehydrogenase (short-subunit alcohol dehydrogenase family)